MIAAILQEMIENPVASQSGLPPPPDKSQKNSHQPESKLDQTMYQRNLFMSLGLDMTWQLALVVIVPIVGGYALDEHYHKTPWLLLAGFVIAAIGVFGVLSRVVSEAGQRSGYSKPRRKP
jgi:F0F1-type ATP synthase assembly protein I